MIVWLIESSQKRHRLIDSSFRPCFYVQGPERQLARLAEALTARAAVSCALTERQNIWDRRMLRVLQVAAHHPTLFAPMTRFVRRFDSSLALYDSDLMLASMYCWEKNVFPLAQVEIEARSGGFTPPFPGWRGKPAATSAAATEAFPTAEIHSITCRDDEWLTEYERPPVRTMRLRLEGISDVNPKHGRHGSIEVAVENDWQTLDDSDEPSAQVFARLLRVHDPDVLVTEWGDDVLLPGLLRQAYCTGNFVTRTSSHRPSRSGARGGGKGETRKSKSETRDAAVEFRVSNFEFRVSASPVPAAKEFCVSMCSRPNKVVVLSLNRMRP